MKENKKEQMENENIEEEKNEQEKSAQELLQENQRELEDITDRYKRILAEFENHKKRSQKERSMLYQ